MSVPSISEYPYKTLEELQASSPSRQHGLTEEQEERWKRAAVNLIITAGMHLRMDHLAVVTALEFLHKFYAEYSMVTNDRFLIATACLYLGGKVADAPKACRDVIIACVDRLCTSREEGRRLWQDREWMEAARERVFLAERAILYQIGFRFSTTTAPEAVIHALLDQSSPVGLLFTKHFADNLTARSQFSQTCMHLANQTAKIPLVLQYKAEAVAAACIWLGMKLFQVNTAPLATAHYGKPWYTKFDLTNKDLESITAQISLSVVHDAEVAKEWGNVSAISAEISPAPP